MRSILVALLVGTAAASLAYAHGVETTARSAGTLTCRIDPALGLVLGDARGGACHLTTTGGQRQSYAAILPPGTKGEGARTLTWHVRTADGRARPGLLDGRFMSEGALLRGERADLTPIDAAGETGLRLAADDARVTLGAR